MNDPKAILGGIVASRALDVATGGGGFIGFLREGAPGLEEIVGLDSEERAAAAFSKNFDGDLGIRFVKGDAAAMDFPDSSFDLVSVSNSLHHFADPGLVLAEMLRVTRPGGTVVVSEMRSDAQTEPQMTHVLLHHWWGAVDRSLGIVHNDTYSRATLVSIVSAVGLTDLRLYDLSDSDGDPKAPELLAELYSIIDRYVERAGDRADLRERGSALRERVASIGYHGAPMLIAIGKKP